nr:hypothetical protein [Burkholderia vietnamiensis]
MATGPLVERRRTRARRRLHVRRRRDLGAHAATVQRLRAGRIEVRARVRSVGVVRAGRHRLLGVDLVQSVEQQQCRRGVRVDRWRPDVEPPGRADRERRADDAVLQRQGIGHREPGEGRHRVCGVGPPRAAQRQPVCEPAHAGVPRADVLL